VTLSFFDRPNFVVECYTCVVFIYLFSRGALYQISLAFMRINK
jgi:hypothetical protein